MMVVERLEGVVLGVVFVVALVVLGLDLMVWRF